MIVRLKYVCSGACECVRVCTCPILNIVHAVVWCLVEQDRAFRIGQRRDVEVYRLLSVGTIEEIVYLRQVGVGGGGVLPLVVCCICSTDCATRRAQVYKQQIEAKVTTGGDVPLLFSGVQKDSSHKGELFGMENLLSYKPAGHCHGLLRRNPHVKIDMRTHRPLNMISCSVVFPGKQVQFFACLVVVV